MRATLGDNPYHNQHIKEVTAAIDDSVTELQVHYDAQLQQMCDAITALDARVERLEALFMEEEKRKEAAPPTVAAEVCVTKASLKKVRDAIMNMFR